MQSLNLAIELSNMALQETSGFKSPSDLIQKTKDRLQSQVEILGLYMNCVQGYSKKMNDVQMEEYQLQYEKQTLAFQFIYFRPRDSWQIQNFQILGT